MTERTVQQPQTRNLNVSPSLELIPAMLKEELRVSFLSTNVANQSDQEQSCSVSQILHSAGHLTASS